VASLQLQLNGLLTRLSRLEDALDDLRRHPQAPPSAAPVPEAPVAVAPVPPPQAVTPQPEPPSAVVPPSVPEVAAPAPAPASAGTSLEERLGTRWAVWAGGLSLALGGLLLVRFSIEQGIFGPGVRVALGALFSLALIALGEWFRRTERGLPVEAIPAAHVPSVLTAAGTASAFGTAYAAHALYGFIGPAAAFVILGIIGVATMLAAALHGPALAGLGLAGSLVVPMLVSSQTPSPWPLVIYLGVVAAAAYALARFRRWLWLAAAVVVGVDRVTCCHERASHALVAGGVLAHAVRDLHHGARRRRGQPAQQFGPAITDVDARVHGAAHARDFGDFEPPTGQRAARGMSA
jgi:uncharacterized membrane protein